MQPKPVQPKRTDFPSFDDYFHAMIQYHLKLSQQHLETVESLVSASRQNNQPVSKEHPVCKDCSNGCECNLKRFTVETREEICFILRAQAKAARSPQYYSGGVQLPERKSVWSVRLKYFLEDHTQ